MLLQSLSDCILFRKLVCFIDTSHLFLLGQLNRDFRSRCAPILLETKHAMRMQSRRWKALAERFLNIRLSDSGRYLNSSQLVHRLMQTKVILTARKLVRRIGGVRDVALCTGMLLSAIINTYHPCMLRRFNLTGADLAQLAAESSEMVLCFNRILGHVSRTGSFRSVPADLLISMQHSANRMWPLMYIVKDAQQEMATRIEHALTALLAAERHIPADEPADSDLRIEPRRMKAQLREKLAEIAGMDALERFDEHAAARVFAFELENSIIGPIDD